MSNREIVAAHYAAGARNDLAAMTADFASDIVWVEAEGFPLGGTYHGTTEVIDRVLTILPGEWEGFGMIPDELYESGDTVIALGRYVGTHRRTRLQLAARAVHIWRLSQGVITDFEQVTDTLLVAQAASEN